MNAIGNLLQETGFALLRQPGSWKNLVMLLIACFLLYLAIGRRSQPLVLCAAAFGMILANLPGAELFHEILFAGGGVQLSLLRGEPVTQECLASLAASGVPQSLLSSIQTGQTITPGIADFLYIGTALGVYPCLFLMGLGASTDFGPLLSRPRGFLLGAVSQFGVFAAMALLLALGFTGREAASSALIAGLGGPAAVFVSSRFAPHLLAPIAFSVCLCMAVAPKLSSWLAPHAPAVQQSPKTGKTELVLFPILSTIFVSLLLPAVSALIGSLMLGNLLRVCGVTERLSQTVQQEFFHIALIFQSLCLGLAANGRSMLSWKTAAVLVLGLAGFCFGALCRALVSRLFRRDACDSDAAFTGLDAQSLLGSILAAGFLLGTLA